MKKLWNAAFGVGVLGAGLGLAILNAQPKPFTIKGSVVYNNKPLGGASISIQCPIGKATGQTQSSGAYQITVPGSSSCEFTVKHSAFGTAGGMFPVLPNQAQYNFSVVANNPGKYMGGYILVRR